MQTQTRIAVMLTMGISITLFGMEVEPGLRRARGNSQVVQNTLKSIFDMPLQSPSDSPKEPRTPDVNLGRFDSEELLEALSDTEGETGIYIHQKTTSAADSSKNWREDGRSKATGSKKIPGYDRKREKPNHFHHHGHQKGFISYTPQQPLPSAVYSSSSSENSIEDIEWPPARDLHEEIALSVLAAQIAPRDSKNTATSIKNSAIPTKNHFNALEETTI